MSTIHRSSTRRRRKPPGTFHTTPTTSAEERLLQQAIAKSKVDQRRQGHLTIPFGPTFFPTVEEFKGNPIHYISSIRPIAEKYGICKIVPPEGWNPPFCVDMESKLKFQTKEQLLYRLQEGISFGDGEEHTPESYMEMATKHSKEWQSQKYPRHNPKIKKEKKEFPKEDGKETMSISNLERDYWDLVETDSHQVSVEYGNDIDTTQYWSGFPTSERGHSLNAPPNPDKMHLPDPEFGTEDFYKETWWNLNNIPCCPDSILRHIKVGITGINVPWLYFGCLFSTFCWHNEDNYMYSINYHHRGAPKQWYGVPGTRKDAEGLERVFKNYLSMKMRDVPNLLHHITTMFSPRLLQQGGVPVCKLIQYPGEFVVTFPRSYHGGFSLGPNVGEAVNFATHNWISYGADASERYRSCARASVFSHDRLTFTMANHLTEQKSFATCEHLLKELQRVISEELRLRDKLIESGIRDVSNDINLPKNRLDQLDEDSADYDDKRLCHTCKHVCFFSAVACHCSQSKVSCLRHSHNMCRCPVQKKYMMVWSPQQEMMETLEGTERYCQLLKEQEGESADMSTKTPDETLSTDGPENTPANYISDENDSVHIEVLTRAPGALKDWKAHCHDEVSCDPVTQELKKVITIIDLVDSETAEQPSPSKKIRLETTAAKPPQRKTMAPNTPFQTRQ